MTTSFGNSLERACVSYQHVYCIRDNLARISMENKKIFISASHYIVDNKKVLPKYTIAEGWNIYLSDSMGIETKNFTHFQIRDFINPSNGISIDIKLLNFFIKALASLKRKINLYKQ